MTLKEFTKPFLKAMANTVTLIYFLSGKRKDKEIDSLVKYFDGKYFTKIRRIMRIYTISTVIYTIIDILIEIGLIILIINSNNRDLQILLTIIAFDWVILNIKLRFLENCFGDFSDKIIDMYENKQFHKTIESSKKLKDEFSDAYDRSDIFDSFLRRINHFKLNVCSLGKYEKLMNEFDNGNVDEFVSEANYYNIYSISHSIYSKMFNEIYSVLCDKYKTSKEIFNDNDIDKLNEYIDKKFDTSFIESVYENITPSDNEMINILFIMLLIIRRHRFDAREKINDDNIKFLSINVSNSNNPIDWGIRIIEFKIFQYGFDKLENIIMCMNDEEMLKRIHHFKTN